MVNFELEFDETALRSAVQDAFDDYVDNEGVDYECPGCGCALTVRTGDNRCPECGFVIVVEKGQLQS